MSPAQTPEIMNGASVVLASQSEARARMLQAAGVRFDIEPVRIDEQELRQGFVNEGARGEEIAAALAEIKALRASGRTERLVIAADQILSLDKEIFAKPASLEEARVQLLKLRGQTHELASAVCVAKSGSVIWRKLDTAELKMRRFSDDFLDWYLRRHGDRVMTSVGGYQIEGEGLQLFESIKGDYFTILGLPLTDLLAFLRAHGMLLS